MKFKTKKIKKIFFWSPLLGHVGTINAVIGMATSLNRFNYYEIYLINLFGEFDEYKNFKDFKVISFFNFVKYFSKTGILSKIFIYFFSLLSIPQLIYQIIIIKLDAIISNLVGYIPCILKFFFRKLIIINSIQGFPKFTFLRIVL